MKVGVDIFLSSSLFCWSNVLHNTGPPLKVYIISGSFGFAVDKRTRNKSIYALSTQGLYI